MSLIKNTFNVGFWTLISRFLGYVRDAFVAFFLGAGAINDAFIIAFRLPNLFRTIFGEGAFSAAFVPLFSKVLHKDGHAAAQRFAAEVQLLLFFTLVLFSIVMIIFMPEVMLLTAYGYANTPEVLELATALGRITFPYIIFVSFMAFYGGILNSAGKFFAFASAPIILNIVQIIAISLVPQGEAAGYALSYGALVAGVLEMLWVMVFAYRAGFRFGMIVPSADSQARVLLRKMGPGIIGSSIAQINVWVGTIIATFVPAGVSYLYYADRVYHLPLALIGTAMGTVLLASLSKHIAGGDRQAAIKMQNQAIEFCMLLTLPAAFGLALLSEGIVDFLFGRGEFNSTAVKETANALFVFSIGLPAFVLTKIFINSFFAEGDTKTPVKVAFLALLVNLGLSWFLLPQLRHISIAVGAVVSAWLSVVMLVAVLLKRKQMKLYRTTVFHMFKMLLACSCMSIIVFMMQILALSAIPLLFLQIFIGAIIYFSLLLMLKVHIIFKPLRRI